MEFTLNPKKLFAVYHSKSRKNPNKSKEVTAEVDSVEECEKDMWYIINHVIGHEESDTIVGNFTGKGKDTLFIASGIPTDKGLYIYTVKSNNKKIPPLDLYGCGEVPGLVNEGDLDGNGTCEFGYIYTWGMSQWRIYHIFTLLNGSWRYLIDIHRDFMDTGDLIRGSGKEIAEPSGKKGWVKINYQTQGVNETIKDTIVKPDFAIIKD